MSGFLGFLQSNPITDALQGLENFFSGAGNTGSTNQVKTVMQTPDPFAGWTHNPDGSITPPDNNPSTTGVAGNALGRVFGPQPTATPAPAARGQLSPQYQAMINDRRIPDNAKEDALNILNALNDQGILNQNTAAYALATAQHETASSFKPVREGYYADAANGGPGSTGRLMAQKLGYDGGPDYYGRGYIQLTGKGNYARYDQALGLNGQLVNNPDLALDPQISAKILATYMKQRGTADMASNGQFYGARGTVNGDTATKGPMIANDAKGYLNDFNTVNGGGGQ